MKLSEKTGTLKIYTGETDKVNGRLLFEEIVFEARIEFTCVEYPKTGSLTAEAVSPQ